MSNLEAFDIYVKNGLRIIPLLPFSKKPFFGNWQDVDLYDASACRRIVEARANYNLGMLLGDIVDVEGDSDEANEVLEGLIGDLPHPRYRSSRSTHHLFLNHDPELTRVVAGKIEFRGHRHQSVLPPSRHADGMQYKWLGGKFPAPEMPNRLKDLLRRYSPGRSPAVGRLCPGCEKIAEIHGKRLGLEMKACRKLNVRWECNKCRTYDLRPLVRHLKRISR